MNTEMNSTSFGEHVFWRPASTSWLNSRTVDLFAVLGSSIHNPEARQLVQSRCSSITHKAVPPGFCSTVLLKSNSFPGTERRKDITPHRPRLSVTDACTVFPHVCHGFEITSYHFIYKKIRNPPGVDLKTGSIKHFLFTSHTLIEWTI
jgi:hypothetical protein